MGDLRDGSHWRSLEEVLVLEEDLLGDLRTAELMSF